MERVLAAATMTARYQLKMRYAQLICGMVFAFALSVDSADLQIIFPFADFLTIDSLLRAVVIVCVVLLLIVPVFVRFDGLSLRGIAVASCAIGVLAVGASKWISFLAHQYEHPYGFGLYLVQYVWQFAIPSVAVALLCGLLFFANKWCEKLFGILRRRAKP
ncbi:MAG: hypothetical protein HND43_09220 [Armatimonadetes bacterium]|nr:hypothetical protein [Armatimonadota bacterium]